MEHKEKVKTVLSDIFNIQYKQLSVSHLLICVSPAKHVGLISFEKLLGKIHQYFTSHACFILVVCRCNLCASSSFLQNSWEIYVELSLHKIRNIITAYQGILNIGNYLFKICCDLFDHMVLEEVIVFCYIENPICKSLNENVSSGLDEAWHKLLDSSLKISLVRMVSQSSYLRNNKNDQCYSPDEQKEVTSSNRD